MFGPDPDARGGIASVIDTYRRAGAFRRLHVRFVPSYRDGSWLTKLASYVGAVGALLAALVGRRPGAIHLHTAIRTSLMRKASLALLCAVWRVPVVWHIHSGEFVDYVADRLGRRRRSIVLGLLSRAGAVIVLTDGWRRQLSERLGIERNVFVLPNPAPPQLPAPAARPPGEQGRLRVLFLGLFTESKGFRDLLRATALARGQGYAVTLACAGQGDVARVQDWCRDLNLDGAVSFLGWIDADQRQAEFQHIDVLALPSYSEGQPMSVIEAMQAGLAVVATRVGGIPDTVTDGVEGLLVPPGDVPALAQALCRLAADPGLRHKLGQAGLVRAEVRHAPAAVIDRLASVYATVLADPGRSYG